MIRALFRCHILQLCHSCTFLLVDGNKLFLLQQAAAFRRSIDERIIQRQVDPSMYKCMVCDMSISGEIQVSQHLDGNKHREKGAKFAIKNLSTAHQSLIGFIPPKTRYSIDCCVYY